MAPAGANRIYRGTPYLVPDPDGPFSPALLDSGRRFIL